MLKSDSYWFYTIFELNLYQVLFEITFWSWLIDGQFVNKYRKIWKDCQKKYYLSLMYVGILLLFWSIVHWPLQQDLRWYRSVKDFYLTMMLKVTRNDLQKSLFHRGSLHICTVCSNLNSGKSHYSPLQQLTKHHTGIELSFIY